MDYCKRCDTTDGCEIVKHEFESVLWFFSQFSPENLYHCVIAEHIQRVAERVKYDSKDILLPFLSSRKYQIYNILNTDRSEMLHLGHREYDEYHRAQVTAFMQEYGLDEFQYLLQVCKECIETVDPKAQKLSYGVECAIGAFAPNNELFVAVVNAYLDADTPYNVRAYGIIQSLLRIMTADEVKRMIDKHDFSQKSIWLWDFYVELPTDQITSAWADNFLLYCRIGPNEIIKNDNMFFGQCYQLFFEARGFPDCNRVGFSQISPCQKPPSVNHTSYLAGKRIFCFLSSWITIGSFLDPFLGKRSEESPSGASDIIKFLQSSVNAICSDFPPSALVSFPFILNFPSS